MSVWGWVLVAAGAAIVFSVAIALALARILGRIAEDVNELLEQEEWSSAPLTRMLEAPDEVEEAAQPTHAGDRKHRPT
jgi:hypothetical protein